MNKQRTWGSRGGCPAESFHLTLTLPGTWILEEAEVHSPQAYRHTSACPVSIPSGKSEQILAVMLALEEAAALLLLASPSDGEGTGSPVSTQPSPGWATCLRLNCSCCQIPWDTPSHHPPPPISHQKKPVLLSHGGPHLRKTHRHPREYGVSQGCNGQVQGWA